METPDTPIEHEDIGDQSLKPIVIKSGKKKKFKYTRGLGDFQKTSRRASKVAGKMARASAKGIETFRKASDKSARKKRDGALRDFGLNAAKGVSKSLRVASSTPYDIAKAFDRRSSRRLIRRQIKTAARMARLMRMR